MTHAPSAPDLNASASKNAGPNAPVVTIRPSAETMTRQQLPYFLGIAGTTAGATGLSINFVVIPPGGAASRTSTVVTRRLFTSSKDASRRVTARDCDNR